MSRALLRLPPCFALALLVAAGGPVLAQEKNYLLTIRNHQFEPVELEVPAGAPGLLVLTDAYFPGWRATVNGRPAPIMPTDVAFRGVMLNGDGATVVFTYHSPGGNLGWGIPVLAGLTLIAAAFVLRARSQRADPEYVR